VTAHDIILAAWRSLPHLGGAQTQIAVEENSIIGGAPLSGSET